MCRQAAKEYSHLQNPDTAPKGGHHLCSPSKYSKSLYVGSDVTENSHEAKGITVIYCKGNFQYYTGDIQ